MVRILTIVIDLDRQKLDERFIRALGATLQQLGKVSVDGLFKQQPPGLTMKDGITGEETTVINWGAHG